MRSASTDLTARQSKIPEAAAAELPLVRATGLSTRRRQDAPTAPIAARSRSARGLERDEELRETILDATPIASAWVDASKAICDGDLPRAAKIIDGIGHPAAAAYAHLRATMSLAAPGDAARAAVERTLAEPFYTQVGAVFLLEDGTTFGSALETQRHCTRRAGESRPFRWIREGKR